DISFRDNAHLMQIIDRIVSKIGRRVDESSPYVDARLPDGSRVNVIIPPLAIDGPILSIRRFGVTPLGIKDLIRFGSIDERIAMVLEGIVKTRLNVLISGGSGTGKTTLLNAMSEFIPDGERIITIEDSAELQLKQEHVVRLETRPPNIEGKGEVTQRDLVRNALRMRPDRIIVGEVRGGEALDMLQAMNTGHDGSLSTIHANSTRDALARLETMVLMSGMDLPQRAIREQIASSINIIVHQVRFFCGTRKITHITEICGIENGVILTQDIFLFKQSGFDSDGKVKGKLLPTGMIPKFYEDLRNRGYPLDLSIFSQGDDPWNS
ncbi:MAG: CpaF family protein, partial [Candidatus Aenigmatarchaeota archaeon]